MQVVQVKYHNKLSLNEIFELILQCSNLWLVGETSAPVNTQYIFITFLAQSKLNSMQLDSKLHELHGLHELLECDLSKCHCGTETLHSEPTIGGSTHFQNVIFLIYDYLVSCDTNEFYYITVCILLCEVIQI